MKSLIDAGIVPGQQTDEVTEYLGSLLGAEDHIQISQPEPWGILQFFLDFNHLFFQSLRFKLVRLDLDKLLSFNGVVLHRDEGVVVAGGFDAVDVHSFFFGLLEEILQFVELEVVIDDQGFFN